MKEVIPIGITIEYLSALNTAHHDMVDGVCGIYA